MILLCSVLIKCDRVMPHSKRDLEEICFAAEAAIPDYESGGILYDLWSSESDDA